MKCLGLGLIAFSSFFAGLPQIHCVQKKYITGNGFRSCASYIVENYSHDFNPATISPRSIVYIEVDSLDYFFDTVFPRISVPIIIITHNGDRSAPGEYASYLDNPKIIHWFGQNCDVAPHQKFSPIPIGLANAKWAHGNTEVFDAVLKIIHKTQPQKRSKLYINYSPTHPCRTELTHLFKNKPYVSFASRKNLKEYLLEMAQYQFTLSPFGNGLDSHRTWEALLVGSIPVVKTSTLDPLYTDLPVVIVQEWSEITEDFLEKKYEEIASKSYNYKKIWMPYWINLCTSLQNKKRD